MSRLAQSGRLVAALFTAAVIVAPALPASSARVAEAAKPVPTFVGTASVDTSSGACTYSYSFVSDGNGMGIIEVEYGPAVGTITGVAQIPLRESVAGPIAGTLTLPDASAWFRLDLLDMRGNLVTTGATPLVTCPL